VTGAWLRVTGASALFRQRSRAGAVADNKRWTACLFAPTGTVVSQPIKHHFGAVKQKSVRNEPRCQADRVRLRLSLGDFRVRHPRLSGSGLEKK
jgi:hypothetical protein